MDFHKLWVLWLGKAFKDKVEECSFPVTLGITPNLRKSGVSHYLHPMDLPLPQNASVMQTALALSSNDHG